MSRLSRLSLFLLLAALPSLLFGAEGYPSLKFAMSARDAGMGETGVGGSQGAAALRFNPGLGAEGKAFEASVYHTRWLLGTSQSAIFLNRNFGKLAVGAEIIYFTSGEVELRDSVNSKDPLGSYSFSDLSFGTGIAWQFVPGASVGLTARYYHERLWYYSGSTWGFDAGLSYTPIEGLRIGVSVLDLGFDMHLYAESFKPPMTLRVGQSFTHAWTVNLATTLNTDFLYRPYSKEPGLNAGLEVELFELLSLRTGVKTLYSDSEIRFTSPTELLTFGIGLKHNWVSVDYALVPYRMDLGLTHRVSLNFTVP